LTLFRATTAGVTHPIVTICKQFHALSGHMVAGRTLQVEGTAGAALAAAATSCAYRVHRHG
jgi:hypothetical protein